MKQCHNGTSPLKKNAGLRTIEQAHFKKSYMTIDNLQAVKVVIEKSVKYYKALTLAFIHNALDTVELTLKMAALEQCRIDYKYTSLIEYIPPQP